MRRVEVEPEALARDRLEHVIPGRGRRSEVVPARPLVPAEDHRAVLDRDPHPALGGVRYERRPDLLEALEVLRVGAVLVVPDEGADRPDPKPDRKSVV